MTTLRGVTTSATNTGTEPSGTANGDKIFAFAYSASSLPSLPTGWTTEQSVSDSTHNIFIRFASIIRGSSAPSYIFTNASQVDIWSIVSGSFAAYATSAFNSYGGNAPSSPATTLSNVDYAVSVGASRSSIPVVWTAPTGFTLREGSTSRCPNSADGSGVGAGPYTWGASTSTAFQIMTLNFQPSATTVTKTATFDAVLAKRQSLTATLDAVFATKTTKTATFDAAMANPTLKTATLDGVLAALVAKTATFDADFLGQLQKTATFDAVLAVLQQHVATLDGVFATKPALTALMDAVFASVVTKTATFDGHFANTATLAATYDADLSKQMFVIGTFDAYLGEPMIPMAGAVNGVPPVPAGRVFSTGAPSPGTVTGAQPPASGRVVPHVPGL